MRVNIKVEPADLPFTLVGSDEHDYFSFTGDEDSEAAFEDIYLTANETLPDVVNKYSFDTAWTLVMFGNYVATGFATNTQAYVTYDTPNESLINVAGDGTPKNNQLTLSRIEWLTTAVQNASTEGVGLGDKHDIADAIHDKLNESYNIPMGTPSTNQLWKAVAVGGECRALASLNMAGMQLLGIAGGVVVYVYQDADEGSYEENTPGQHKTKDGNKHLQFNDKDGENSVYEACYKLDAGEVTKYYAGGDGTFGLYTDDPAMPCHAVALGVFASTEWWTGLYYMPGVSVYHSDEDDWPLPP